MKVIDLLSKIANGEEVPKLKLEHSNDNDIGYELYMKVGKTNEYDFYKCLNEEIEIIEEDKKIEKIDFCEENTFSNMKECTHLSPKERRLLDSNFKELGNKINELIDEVNKLKGGKE